MNNFYGFEREYQAILEELEYEKTQSLIDEQEYRETKTNLEEEYQQKVTQAISLA